MFISYLKMAFRNMWKYKTQSLTGIIGLAFAIACFVPALYWMRYETSYDSSYPDSERIYRIYSKEKESGKINSNASSIMEKKLHEQFPAIEASTAFMSSPEICRTEEMPHIQLKMLYSDSTYFTVFPQTIICGNMEKPLQVSDDMVLTESMAVRMFGSAEKAIGQKVQTKMSSKFPPYVVTAVMKDPSAHSSQSFDAIIVHHMLDHFSSLPEEVQWTLFYMEVYVKFHSNAPIGEIEGQMRDLTTRLGTNPKIEVMMMPVSDIRHNLNSDVPFTLNFIGLFMASGILLLFTAIFNFLNLHLDLFRQRSRELHLRAVNGAAGGQLIRQMLCELSYSIFLSLLISAYLVILIRPVFIGLLGIEISMQPLMSMFAVCGIGILVLMLLIGFMLFWRLSHVATRPRSESKTTGQPMLRRIAVTLQLGVSLVFIVSALVVMMQMAFVNHKDLGFDSKGLIQLTGFTDVRGSVQNALIQKLKAIPQVESITDTNFKLQHKSNPFTATTRVEWEGKSSDENPDFNAITVDPRFAETFKLKMIGGKWLEDGQRNKIVINEEAARLIGFSEPVGSIIRMPSWEDISVMAEYEIAGVVQNFHTLSLRNHIQPIFFVFNDFPLNNLYIRVAPGREQEVIKKISEMLPGIDASMADAVLTPVSDLYTELNRPEQVGFEMFSVLATVCLLISLFGIYAVAVAATRRRRKEIAIRKVVGAEVGSIIHMFFREYTLQVATAGALALPLAYLAMNNWLQGYAYRINIPVWLLAGVLTGVIIIVLLTVLGQVLKAAGSNPAEVVKSE